MHLPELSRRLCGSSDIYEHRPGRTITVAFDGRIGRDPEGRFQQTHCIFRDITDRKQHEAETQRRADEFAALYRTARDLAAQYNLPTLLDTIAERACVSVTGWLRDPASTVTSTPLSASRVPSFHASATRIDLFGMS